MSNKKAARKAANRKPPRLVLEFADAYAKMREAAPSLSDIGAEMRGIANMLKRLESYVIVARLALEGQAAAQDGDVAVLLQRGVGDLLFEQIRDLQNLAARCDGGPRSDRDDDEFEDDESGGAL